MNAYACAEWQRLGLSDALCSPEAPAMPRTDLPLGVFAYGRLPLMLTRNCPIKAQVGCGRCRHRLTDRRGTDFWVDCTRCTDSPDYAELFNTVPVWRDVPAADYALLFMTDESPESVREILHHFCGLSEAARPAAYTRGLHIRT